ncbi:putative glycosyltransferase EpsJ [Clostridiales bacterium CHKCI001]|nr:putative glycosyltransferase EpsJ [Clostridiales bacterium CHKCI001]
MESMVMENMDTEDMVNKDNSKLVSVIVPIYNAEMWLEDLLEDLCNQSYDDLEILLVDDGSEDRSGVICDIYAARDSRIRVFHKRNSGVSSARNFGMRNATGTFLKFVDSDDRLSNDSIERLVLPMLKNSNVELSIGAIDTERSLWNSKLEGIVSRAQLIQDMTNSLQGFYYGSMWNKMYLKKIIIKNSIELMENISWCEDYLFNLEYISYISGEVSYTSQYVYQYMIRDGSLVSKVDLKTRILIENLCLSKLHEFAKREGITDSYAEHHAYIKHSQMCNLCAEGVGYKKLVHTCLTEQDVSFWKSYKNSQHFLVYRILKFLICKHINILVYCYIYLKEIAKKHTIRLRKFYYQKHKRCVSLN